MKIGVDAGCLGVKDERLKVGVYNFAKNLLLQLSKVDTENQYFLYSFSPIEKSFMKKLGSNMTNIVVRPTKGWLTIWLPIRMVRDRIDLFLALSQAVPPRMSPLTRTLGYIHDIAFEKDPEFYGADYQSLHDNVVNVVRKSDIIVVSAESVKQDLISFFSADAVKIKVVPMGIRPLKVTKHQRKNNKNYFLYVGALKKGKNVPAIIRAFDQFLKKLHLDYELIIVGGDKWLDPDIQKTLDTVSDETLEKIIFIGFVKDEELAELYKNATAFVSPSFHEGFGLPFVEAMAVGTPVIGSNRGSIPEVVGDAGVLVDPTDVSAIAQAMHSFTKDKRLRETFAKKGQAKSREYSWERTAKEVYALIKRFS